MREVASVPLTDMPKGVADFRWSPDGGSIFLAAKEDKEEPKFREGATARRITRLRYKFNGPGYLDDLVTQLWKVDIATKQVERLTNGPYNCGTPEVSPDGAKLVFTSTRDEDQRAQYSDLWMLDVTTKQMTKLPRPCRTQFTAGDIGS